MNRREFLMSSAAIAAAGATTVAGQAPAAVPPRPPAPPPPPMTAAQRAERLKRVSILTLNFASLIKGVGNGPNATLEFMDIPDMYAERYGVHYVEVFCTHFQSTEKAYFDEFRERLKKAKSKINNISLGGLANVSMSSPNPTIRTETIDVTKRWIDHAAYLDCPCVMVNQGTLALDVLQDATATLKTMSDYGKSKGVKVGLEHRGSSAGAGDLVDTIKAAGAYANLDIGNFGADDVLRHREIRRMMPLTQGSTHMKMSPNWDLPSAVKIVEEEFKYNGVWALEGSGQDPHATTKAMLEALLPLMMRGA
jgi:sugar phosphate isomerase/epimerase